MSDIAAHSRQQASSPIAFIYDRRMPFTPGLQGRLRACATHAFEEGWEIGGWHVDIEPGALTDHDRPALDAAVRAMRRAGPARRRVLLVATLDCLSAGPGARQALIVRVAAAGGEVLAVDTAGVPAEGVAR
jgi:hypothetical protein